MCKTEIRFFKRFKLITHFKINASCVSEKKLFYDSKGCIDKISYLYPLNVLIWWILFFFINSYWFYSEMIINTRVNQHLSIFTRTFSEYNKQHITTLENNVLWPVYVCLIYIAIYLHS